MENNAVGADFLECDPAIDVNSVDWAAVARAYKLIRLSPFEGMGKRGVGRITWQIYELVPFEDREHGARHCPADGFRRVWGGRTLSGAYQGVVAGNGRIKFPYCGYAPQSENTEVKQAVIT